MCESAVRGEIEKERVVCGAVRRRCGGGAAARTICGAATNMHCTNTLIPRIRCMERSGLSIRTNRRVPTTGKSEKTRVIMPLMTTIISIQFQPLSR